MTTIIIVFAVLYLVLGTGIVLRFIDIRNRPEKYEESELQTAAERIECQTPYSGFFKSVSHKYAVVNMGVALLLTAAAYGIIVGCSYWTAGADKNILLDVQIGGVVAAFFLNVIVGLVIIPLHIKTKYFAVSVLDVFNVSDRLSIWKRGYFVFLAFFLVAFPFYSLGCNTYAHYNEEGITVSRFFQIDETYTAYEDIQEVNIYIHHNYHGQVDTMNYELRLKDGKIVDVNDGIGAKDRMNRTTLEIHKLLEQKASCTPTITPLNKDDYEFLKKQSSEQADAVYYIFEGFHR